MDCFEFSTSVLSSPLASCYTNKWWHWQYCALEIMKWTTHDKILYEVNKNNIPMIKFNMKWTGIIFSESKLVPRLQYNSLFLLLWKVIIIIRWLTVAFLIFLVSNLNIMMCKTWFLLFTSPCFLPVSGCRDWKKQWIFYSETTKFRLYQ